MRQAGTLRPAHGRNRARSNGPRRQITVSTSTTRATSGIGGNGAKKTPQGAQVHAGTAKFLRQGVDTMANAASNGPWLEFSGAFRQIWVRPEDPKTRRTSPTATATKRVAVARRRNRQYEAHLGGAYATSPDDKFRPSTIPKRAGTHSEHRCNCVPSARTTDSVYVLRSQARPRAGPSRPEGKFVKGKRYYAKENAGSARRWDIASRRSASAVPSSWPNGTNASLRLLDFCARRWGRTDQLRDGGRQPGSSSACQPLDRLEGHRPIQPRPGKATGAALSSNGDGTVNAGGGRAPPLGPRLKLAAENFCAATALTSAPAVRLPPPSNPWALQRVLPTKPDALPSPRRTCPPT